MPARIIVGAQFGDEGKGKITDFFSAKMDFVARYQGGNNAGHTVCVKDQTFKLHLLPSGVVQKKHLLIGAGVVVDPKVLLEEIALIESLIGKIKLTVDARANIIMPYHVLLDASIEGKQGKIGTTKRGIGPCYSDRAARIGIRFEDLVDEKILREKLHKVFSIKKKILEAVYGKHLDFNEKQVLKEYAAYGKKLRHYLGDVSTILDSALRQKKRVLFEGAQGTFLDNDFGTYPFVTSSHPISAGALVGTGLGLRKIENISGVTKAYTTRVGEGPFPTELHGKQATLLRKQGNEFGTTTGRPRRVGWLDLPLIRTAHRLNNFSELAITKLDVLSGFKEIKICTHYKVGGKKFSEVPMLSKDFEKAKPVYKSFKGFNVSGKEKTFSRLPKEAQNYLKFIEKNTGVKIALVSVGAKRNETIPR